MTSPKEPELPNELPFPPLTRKHILNCSFHSWHPRYRSITPKARLIALSPPFLNYLRADGIFLPPDETAHASDWPDSDSGVFSSTDDSASEASDDTVTPDPSEEWPDIHTAVKSTIRELGGKVVPKLNWSAPKDATWINASNSMDCISANDVYTLLKASDFITHDLEHAFDGCISQGPDDPSIDDIPFHLVLRKHVLWNPSIDFRCFVRNRKIIGICQRDLNHFDFLFDMKDSLRNRIEAFFESKVKDTFPDENFVFDVYIPPPHERVWLVDVNPWAPRTDPLLFSWLELLTMTVPDDSQIAEEEGEEADEEIFTPEFRLVKKNDPEAYSFASPQYSAHKMPLEVVNAASGTSGGLADFASQWQEMLAKQQQQESSSDED